VLIQESLKQFFGFDNFIGAQQETIERILHGEELCVVMPTGAGKSLCYQLPIMMRPGYGLVLSPLIALMRDQVVALRNHGLPSACINSMISPAEQQAIMEATIQGQIKLLYVAPERFHNSAFIQMLENNPPSLLVIDEAHCISQWGHDFRPDYQLIWSQFSFLQKIQLCAFTATATPTVRADIKKQIFRPNMGEIVSGFKRPNLSFQVQKCKNTDKPQILAALLEKKEPCIIYVSTRKNTEEIARKFNLVMYHAGLSAQQRNDAQYYFLHDPCPILVATNAFGMGIDRPDIRKVIHYNAPGSLEAYYQEAGRAGRDRKPASCILLHSYHDKIIQEFLLEINNPDSDFLKALHSYIFRQQQAGSIGFRMDPDHNNIKILKKNIKHIASALRVLERYHIVTREHYASNPAPGELILLQPPAKLIQKYHEEKTQRARFLHRVSLQLQKKDQHILPCNLTDLSTIAALPLPNIMRVLDALEGEFLQWQPSFYGDIYSLSPEGCQEKLNIDLEEVEQKKQYDTQKLDEVQGYCYTKMCRQNYFISYFGEKVDEWKCNCCDNCSVTKNIFQKYGRKATETELTEARDIIIGIASISGEFGRKRLIGMFHGDEDNNPTLYEHPCHGSLKQLPLTEIENLMNALEAQKFIQQTTGEYPCIELSDKSYKFIRSKKPLELVILKKEKSFHKSPHKNYYHFQK